MNVINSSVGERSDFRNSIQINSPFHGQSEMQTSSFLLLPVLVSSFLPSALCLAVFSTPFGLFSSPDVWIPALPLAVQGP